MPAAPPSPSAFALALILSATLPLIRCDMGFPVMNRPHGVTQFLEMLPESLTEQCALLHPAPRPYP